MTGPLWRTAMLGLTLAGLLAAAGPGRALAAPANMVKATDGYVYFNRPGADMAAHDAELRNCLETWQGGVQPQKPTQPIIGGQGILGDAIGTAVAGAMQKGWEKARFAVNVEHCMVVRGWRVARVPADEGKALAALDRNLLAATLAPWVGAATPHGEIVRVFANEAALGDSILVRSPQGSSNVQLGSLAISADAGQPSQPVGMLPNSWLLPRNGIAQAESVGLTSVPEGSALLIVRMTASPAYKNSGMLFELAGPNPPGTPYRATFRISVRKAPRVNGQIGQTYAFVVPAGKWRLYSNASVFDFCLGAPAFEAKAGEVVYLGAINVGPRPPKPDMTLDPAIEFLGAGSALTAKVRPAEWFNGSTSPCRNWHPYAYEFDGAPFEPGYVWGGAARPGG